MEGNQDTRREGYMKSLSLDRLCGKHNPTDLQEYQEASVQDGSLTGVYNGDVDNRQHDT